MRRAILALVLAALCVGHGRAQGFDFALINTYVLDLQVNEVPYPTYAKFICQEGPYTPAIADWRAQQIALNGVKCWNSVFYSPHLVTRIQVYVSPQIPTRPFYPPGLGKYRPQLDRAN